MAYNTITYACNHTTREQLYGPMAARERTIERALDRLCPDCYRAKLDAERAAEAAVAAEAAKAGGLPALTGTPKQVAWAESIRAKQSQDLNALDAALAAAPATADADAVRIGREIIAAMLARTSARDWIDGRDRALDRHWISTAVRARMTK